MKAGRELDALVAEKVMGWAHVRFEGVYWFGKEPGHEHWHSHIPYYSVLLADAWKVVEHFHFPLDTENAYHLKQSFWYYMDEGSNSPLYAWPADKAARIICLSALKAIGALPDEQSLPPNNLR